jgi:hypothetical protein
MKMPFPETHFVGEKIPEPISPAQVPPPLSPAQQEAVLQPSVTSSEEPSYRPPEAILEDDSEVERVVPIRESTSVVGKVALSTEKPETPALNPGGAGADTPGDIPPSGGDGGDNPNGESSGESNEPPETYDTVAAQLRESRQGQDTLLEVITQKLGDHVDSANETIYAVDARFPAGRHPIADLHPEYMTALRGTLDEQTFADAEESLEQYFQAKAAEEQLKEKCDTLALTEYGALIEDLAQNVDWDGVVRSDLESTANRNFWELWHLVGGQHLRPESVEDHLLGLREWKVILEAENYMRTESTPPPDERVLVRQAEWLPEGDTLVEAIAKWERLTEDSFHQLGKERRAALEYEFRKLQTDSSFAVAVANQLGVGNTDHHQTPAPTQITDALRRGVATLFDTFDRTDLDIMDRVQETHLQGILQIESGALATEKLGIADPHAFVEKQMGFFPTWYTRGLNKVYFAEYEEVQKEVPGRGVVSYKRIGCYDSVEGVGLGVTPLFKETREAYYKKYESSEAEKKLRKMSLANVETTWDHEATHHAQMYTIPLPMLRRFQAVAERERISVTPYVAMQREAYGWDVGIQEDLADSVRAYKNTPLGLLEVGGHERFRLLNAMFGLYDPDIIEKAIKYTFIKYKFESLDRFTIPELEELREVYMTLYDDRRRIGKTRTYLQEVPRIFP